MSATTDRFRLKRKRSNCDRWLKQQLAEGWTFGPECSDARKQHPSLIPYDALSTSEQEYDRQTAIATLEAVVALGYRISR